MKKLVIFVLIFSAGFTQHSHAAETGQSLTQTLLLRPTHTPSLRINFDYNFRNALPAFKKEPAFEGKEIARGLIPTSPTTPFIRNITDKELYLNENHSRDFVTGPLTTYKSTYQGHVFFRDIRVFSRQDSLVIPYTVDLVTYEHGCAGWLRVTSGWAGEFELEGQQWTVGIVDNLDGRIDSEDHLFIRDSRQTRSMPLINNCPVPQTLFFSGHTFRLEFVFKQITSGVVLEASLIEIQTPTGELNIEAGDSKHLRLCDGLQVVLLNDPTGTVSLPVGNYQVDNLVPDYGPNQLMRPTFIHYDKTVSIKPDKTAFLRIGPPLRSTVEVSRDKNLLNLKYQLVGAGGEQYAYYNWEKRPSFKIYKGPLKITGGTFPFG